MQISRCCGGSSAKSGICRHQPVTSKTEVEPWDRLDMPLAAAEVGQQVALDLGRKQALISHAGDAIALQAQRRASEIAPDRAFQ